MVWTRRPARRTGTRSTTDGRFPGWRSRIIVVGFIIGGIALPIGPNWVLFWVGVAIVAIGAIFAASIRIMDDWY